MMPGACYPLFQLLTSWMRLEAPAMNAAVAQHEEWITLVSCKKRKTLTLLNGTERLATNVATA